MSKQESHSPDDFLRRPEVERKTGLSRSSLYRLIAEGEFPAPYRLGPRTSGWKWGEIQAWLESRRRVQSGDRGAA